MTSTCAAEQGRQPPVLSHFWRWAYWYGFLAQFTVLPFHQELADSGHFHLLDRCIASLRNNLLFYGILVVGKPPRPKNPAKICKSP